MFGLINKAVSGLVLERYGEEVWREVCQIAGVPHEPFVSMESYPDEVTFRLVGAASTHLNIAPTDILREFGRYWMVFTAEAGYGGLLPAAGETLTEFLRNLNNLHTRLKLSLPHLEPPLITVEGETENSLIVHYRSVRCGLSPLAHGILEGLGERFGLRLDIKATHLPAQDGEHTVFEASWADIANQRLNT